MKRKHITLLTLLAGLALGSLASAQTPPAKQAQAPAPAKKVTEPKPEPKATKEAIPATAEPSVALRFAVSGMTKDNMPKVKGSLTELSATTYACAPCKVEQATAGACPKCKAPLASTKAPLFKSVMPTIEDSSVSLTLDPLHPARLSEIETTLAASSVKIDPAKMPLPGTLQLVIDGTADAAAVAAVQKTLTDANLFNDVKTAIEPSSGKITVVAHAKPTPATRAAVTAALAAGKFQLGDVIFGRVATKG